VGAGVRNNAWANEVILFKKRKRPETEGVYAV